jgi:hypothetical protein
MGESDTDDVDVDEQEDGSAGVLDRRGRSLEQLPLAAFDESTSASDLVREMIDSEQERDERLNAIGDVLADLETLVDGEPMVDADDWRDTDPDAKRKMLEIRLDALVDDVADAIEDDDSDADDGGRDDGLRPETDRSHVGYW